jgi:hypothetical protein
MTKKLTYLLTLFILVLAFTTGLMAQLQTGAIRGSVKDNQNNPLPGVTVQIMSDAIMGTQSYITSETGAFRFPAIPPGTYSIMAEMPGFQTAKRDGILVRLGATITVNFTMEMERLDEAVTVMAPSPTIDVVSSKVATNFDTNILENIPLTRDIYDIVNSAPGAISGEDTRYRYTSFHGSGVRSNVYAIDGVNMTGPAYGRLLTNINQDVTEEIEFVTSALPAEVGNASGAYVNVVTKAGGNRFSGSATLFYTNEDLNTSLWTEEDTDALGISQPASNKDWFDGSVTFGGPLIKDKLWFFTNGRYLKRTRNTNFIPFTDMLGVYHDIYDWKHEERMAFGKLTAQVTSKLKLIGMFNFADRARPLRGDPGPYMALEAFTVWDENVYTGNVQAYYLFNQNTFSDLRFNYVNRVEERLLQPHMVDEPRIMWKSNPAQEITNARWNETFDEKRTRIGGYITHFRDNFLGGDHEIKLGVEWEHFSVQRNCWRADNLSWWWWEDSPYYYGTRTWNGVPNVGYSRIYLSLTGETKEDTFYNDYGRRIGAFFQDNLTIGNRVTLNLGLRFDRVAGHEGAGQVGVAGNPIAVHIGENYIRPYVASNSPDTFPDGINPYGGMSSGEIKDIMVWTNLSPRIGLTFDIFGDGKTVFKASYNRYTEFMMTQFFEVLNPFYTIWNEFRWYDMNFNGILDTEDDYGIISYDYRRFDPIFSKRKLDPDTKSPKTDAINIGIERELSKNFVVGASYIYKHKFDTLEAVAYDPDTGEYWYHMDWEAAQRYYVPFETIVPGTDEYPDSSVTVWVRKTEAPPMFNYATNVPELWNKYRALEFKFQKRMADGWQLLGSIVYSKAWGTWGSLGGQTWGWDVAGNQPNFYTNREGRINVDRPLIIKLMGSIILPYDIVLSGFYKHFSGSAWGRVAQVRPPSSFTNANNAYRWYYTVNLEPSGSRRNKSQDLLDIRLEKQFKIGDRFTIGAYVDVFNVFGWKRLYVGKDDIRRYNPSAENVREPNAITLEPTYQQVSSVAGMREVRFSLKLTF